MSKDDVICAAGTPDAIALSNQDWGINPLNQVTSTKTACPMQRPKNAARNDVPLPSPILYSEPDAQPPESTMPTPKISPAISVWAPNGAGWKVLMSVEASVAWMRLKKMSATRIPTAIRGTPAAKRSRDA